MAEPIRRCVGCRRRRPQGELLRFEVDRGSGRLVPALYRKSGRGVYVCPRAKCFERAVRAKAFGRSLRVEVDARQDAHELAVLALRAVLRRIHGLETGSPTHPSLELLRRQAEELRAEFGLGPEGQDVLTRGPEPATHKVT